MKISFDELGKILPQKGKMRLIDEILEADAENWTAVSRTVVSSGCIFFDSGAGGLPSYVLVEFAAQTVAALIGIRAKKSVGKVKSGFVLSASNFSFERDFFREGEEIEVRSKLESEMGGVFSFSFDFFSGGNPCASGKLTVMQG